MRDILLINYLPDYLREYDDFIKLSRAEAPELQKLYEKSDTIRNNMFVLTADEEGTSRYEKILGITPFHGDELDKRRQRVFAKICERVPFTEKFLRNRLTEICGENEFYLEIVYNEYRVKILLFYPHQSIQFDVLDVIKKIIPANMLTCLSIEQVLPDAFVNIFSSRVGVYHRHLLLNSSSSKSSAAADVRAAFDMGIYLRQIIN